MKRNAARRQSQIGMKPACIVFSLLLAGAIAGAWVFGGGGTVNGWFLASNLKPLTLDVATPIAAAGAPPGRLYKVDVWRDSQRSETAPVLPIIYIPGWGGARSDNTALSSALVRAGYVVLAVDDVALDPPYADAFDESARIAPFDLSTEAATRRFVTLANRRAELEAQKVSQLLDALAAASAQGREPALQGLQFERLGVLGYSFGGGVAAELGKRDRRVAAVINFDGWHFGDGADQPALFPYLMLNSIESRPAPEAERLADSYRRNEARLNAAEDARQVRQASLRADTVRLYLRGAVHSDLSDGVAGWRRLLAGWKPGSNLIAPAQARHAIDAVTVAFFDSYLRQNRPGALQEVLDATQSLVNLGTRSIQ